MSYEDVLRSLKVKDNLFVGNSISGNGLINTPGDVWYVNSNNSASGGGRSWDSAFITLKEAVDAAAAWDTILIAPATIQTIATAGITITQTGLRIMGAGPTAAGQPSALKKTAGATPMFIIGADRVEISNLCLSQRTASTCIQIGTDAQSTAGTGIYSTYIHDINFDGYGTALYAVAPNESVSVVDAVNLVVEDCYFAGHVTAAIRANATRDTYRRNVIRVATDGIGIHSTAGAGDRDYTVISDNTFFGLAATTTKGILFDATPTAGTLVLARNYLCGTWNVTITDVAGGCMNYVTDASGGALINC